MVPTLVGCALPVVSKYAHLNFHMTSCKHGSEIYATPLPTPSNTPPHTHIHLYQVMDTRQAYDHTLHPPISGSPSLSSDFRDLSTMNLTPDGMTIKVAAKNHFKYERRLTQSYSGASTEVIVSSVKLTDMLCRHLGQWWKAKCFKAWRAYAQDAVFQRKIMQHRKNALKRVTLAKIWFLWRIYVLDQKRMKGHDMQCMMENFRFRLRALKSQVLWCVGTPSQSKNLDGRSVLRCAVVLWLGPDLLHHTTCGCLPNPE